jgi:hypothetical protein
MYSQLDTKKTNELFLVRAGLFNPEYLLTDNISDYGKMNFRWFPRVIATAVTAANTWVFKREGGLSRTVLITDTTGATVGKATREIFSRITVLSLQTGFMAKFYRPSIWSRQHVWESDGYGRIIHFRCNPFGFKNTVYIDQSMAPVSVIPLLIFFGSYLTTLQRRKRAAH